MIMKPTGQWESNASQNISVRFAKDNNALSIISNGGKYTFGRWTATFYLGSNASLSIKTDASVNTPGSRTYVAVKWIAKNGETLACEYALPDGDLAFTLDAAVPPRGSIGAIIELGFWCFGEGRVSFTYPEITISEKKSGRNVTVAAAYVAKCTTVDMYHAEVLKAIKMCGELKNPPDILAFCETVHTTGIGLPPQEAAICIDDAIVKEICKCAAQQNMYIILPIIENGGSAIYNTALLIDRTGQICYTHRKTHLAHYEMIEGITPGERLDVFETDFGKISILICYEHYFPEPARIAHLRGAELLFIVTIGNTDTQARARAIDTGLHTIVAGADPLDGTKIISPNGEIIRSLCSEKTDVIAHELDLAKKSYQPWLSFDSAGHPNSIYQVERRPDLYEALVRRSL